MHEIYFFIYITARKIAAVVLSGVKFYVLISLPNLDTRQNMRNKNEAVLMYHKSGISVLVSKKLL